MKANYKINNQTAHLFSNSILVYNYNSNNEILNLPAVKNTILLKYRDGNMVGQWKIKNLKQ